jgi:hypothetical protein
MLRKLPPKVAKAFVLAEACRMSDAEVAARLKVSERTVRNYVAQATLAALRLLLDAKSLKFIDETEMTTPMTRRRGDRPCESVVWPRHPRVIGRRPLSSRVQLKAHKVGVSLRTPTSSPLSFLDVASQEIGRAHV